MSDIDTLHENQTAFEGMLPGLLKSNPGEFAVVADGHVVLFAPTHIKAYGEAIHRLGVDRTFFIGAVKELAPVSASVSWDAGVMFVR